MTSVATVFFHGQWCKRGSSKKMLDHVVSKPIISMNPDSVAVREVFFHCTLFAFGH